MKKVIEFFKNLFISKTRYRNVSSNINEVTITNFAKIPGITKEMFAEEMKNCNDYQKELRDAKKTKDWLREYAYDYVCWNEFGSGQAMASIMNLIKQLPDDASESEVIEFKNNVLHI